MQTAKILLALPLFIKKFAAYLLRTLSRPDGRNEAWASLLEVFHPCTVSEERQMVIEKDLYAQEWHRRWSAEQLDFILTVPFATPAIPKGSTGKATLIAATYCYLWNFVRIQFLYSHARSQASVYFSSWTILQAYCL